MRTIKDVAELSGVSIATVSRILNNRGKISEKTRQKVYGVMKELNYFPNEMARSLQSKSRIIGIIVPHIHYPFFSYLLESVEEACSAEGYKLLLCKSGGEGEKEADMVSMLRANKVAGILLCSRVGDTSVYTDCDMPIISIDRDIPHIPYVTSNNYNGGELAAQALAAAGCKSPILFSGRFPEYMAASLRNTGFQDECERRGMKCLVHYINQTYSATDPLPEAFLKFVKEHPEADGIFANGDVLAVNLMIGIRKQHMKELADLPIVGYDGLEASEHFDLTTIAQPIREMGECAVDLLLKKIKGKMVPERSVLPVRLVERASTLAAPKHAKARQPAVKTKA